MRGVVCTHHLTAAIVALAQVIFERRSCAPGVQMKGLSVSFHRGSCAYSWLTKVMRLGWQWRVADFGGPRAAELPQSGRW